MARGRLLSMSSAAAAAACALILASTVDVVLAAAASSSARVGARLGVAAKDSAYAAATSKAAVTSASQSQQFRAGVGHFKHWLRRMKSECEDESAFKYDQEGVEQISRCISELDRSKNDVNKKLLASASVNQAYRGEFDQTRKMLENVRSQTKVITEALKEDHRNAVEHLVKTIGRIEHVINHHVKPDRTFSDDFASEAAAPIHHSSIGTNPEYSSRSFTAERVGTEEEKPFQRRSEDRRIKYNAIDTNTDDNSRSMRVSTEEDMPSARTATFGDGLPGENPLAVYGDDQQISGGSAARSERGVSSQNGGLSLLEIDAVQVGAKGHLRHISA